MNNSRKKVHVDIGINSAFMTRRYEEADSWINIIGDMGFEYMSFDSDALDPFFSGEPDYLKEKAAKIGETARRAGITITDFLTGYCSYRFMGLSHREKQQRDRMAQWMRGAIDIAAAMGAGSVGGRFDALSVEVLENPEERQARIDETIRYFRELGVYAKKAGLSNLANEIMYVPSLYPYTLEGTPYFFDKANCPADADQAPIRPIVDTGHCCGQNYGVSGDDLLYERWMEDWGAACEIIHIQQTRRTASDHAAFLENDGGDVRVETILSSLKKSIDNAQNLPWGGYLEVPDRIILILEALPGTKQTEESMLSELKESARYLRRFIPAGGIDL